MKKTWLVFWIKEILNKTGEAYSFFLLVYQNQVCIPLFPILHPNVKIDISLVQTSRHPLECVRDRVDTNFDDLEEWKIIHFSF